MYVMYVYYIYSDGGTSSIRRMGHSGRAYKLPPRQSMGKHDDTAAVTCLHNNNIIYCNL